MIYKIFVVYTFLNSLNKDMLFLDQLSFLKKGFFRKMTKKEFEVIGNF